MTHPSQAPQATAYVTATVTIEDEDGNILKQRTGRLDGFEATIETESLLLDNISEVTVNMTIEEVEVEH